MLNQIIPAATEANSSGLFLKNYLDYIEEFPDDIVKIISICRELDVKTNNIMNESEELSEKITNSTGDKKTKLYARLQQILIKLQDLKDEKISYGQILSDMIETKFRAVDRDFQNNINKQDRIQSPIPSSSSTARNASIVQQVFSALPLKNSSAPGSNMSSSTNNSASENNNGSGQDKGAKRARRTRTDTAIDSERIDIPIKSEVIAFMPTPTSQTASNAIKKSSSGNATGGKKKKAQRKTSARQSGGQNAQVIQEPVAGALQDDTIDPDEETYCLCGQISYGEMILCENDLCKIEWFHFSCVSLQSKPKGRWYCPNCRGDRPNVMNKNLRKKYQDSPNTDRKFI
ncbi:CLUMA_CG017967, isoform A [Clunio marinus]|uniref:Inhibitor of growth protein n=1 Tax=Clunio marinus TaxID=568069 RepID=A0A1J1IXL3_9DIPT|nr:CLUMA_CG017967, isoform A [Clunio marinus]